MIKFDLPEGFYIRKLDSRNWILAKVFKQKNKDFEKIYGYHGTLEGAWISFCDKIPLQAEKCSQLAKIISDLKKLKQPFAQFIKNAEK